MKSDKNEGIQVITIHVPGNVLLVYRPRLDIIDLRNKARVIVFVAEKNQRWKNVV